jgi:hypothetical protein
VGPIVPAVPVAGALLCVLWWTLIRSYRDLNTVKFEVIHELEKRLPARLYAYEWEKAEHGKNPDRYKPLTHVEVAVPWVFALFHALIFIALKS